MPLTPRHCSQCGHPVETRPLDDRLRQVCPRCDTVFYQNPLPVAAALVLNEERQVLLVRRKNEPYRGMWCLPIGFAELEETIAEAALRELEEEAGVQGRVVRLLDAGSTTSDRYGELLIVTFEVEKTGGCERAGDDAEAVAYFPLRKVPPLAFRPNEVAIRACAQAHGEEWAIQDSYRALETAGGREMLSDPLVALVHNRSSEIADRWLAAVRTSPTTQSYRQIHAERLLERVTAALSQLTLWLGGGGAEEEVLSFYESLGAERRSQGFELHEIIGSLTLLHSNIWTFARDRAAQTHPIDVYRVLELDRRLETFFDQAVYHTARGYAEADRIWTL